MYVSIDSTTSCIPTHLIPALQICTSGILSKLPLSCLHQITNVAIFTLHHAQELKEDHKNRDDDEAEEEGDEEDEGSGAEELVGEEKEVADLTLNFLVTLASG